jgi:S-adenosylmethionine uptake transporter
VLAACSSANHRPASLAGSLIAFSGVIVIVLGQALGKVGPEVLLGSAAIIGSALCYAVNIVLMRRQALAAKPLEINFFQCVTSRSCGCCGAAARPAAWPSGQWRGSCSPRLMSTAAACSSPGPMPGPRPAISR